VDPVSAEIEIDAPRQRAFATIADLAFRPAFTDHFLQGFHLTRIESTGVGAGARYQLRMWPRSTWEDTAIVELREPHLVIEQGRGGRANRIPSRTVWELVEGTGSLVRVRVSHWTEPANPLDQALEALSGAPARQQRAWAEALRRLRELLESETPLVAPMVVAGGNPHATGIP
jgi:uncharacterized protein YndB with AHSA1/START domain